MKKIILIIAMGALILSAKKTEAQSFVASFGIHHNWGISHTAHFTIANHYNNYNWVHAARVVHNGHVSFNVILQDHNRYVELNIGSGGQVYERTYYDYYPLTGHVCSGHCGYHQDYYNTYSVSCSGHHHNGHNHVIYRPNYRPYYRPAPVKVVYSNYQKKHGHYKHPKSPNHKKHYSTQSRTHVEGAARSRQAQSTRSRNVERRVRYQGSQQQRSSNASEARRSSTERSSRQSKDSRSSTINHNSKSQNVGHNNSRSKSSKSTVSRSRKSTKNNGYQSRRD